MGYFLTFVALCTIILFFYRRRKNVDIPLITVSIQADNTDWEGEKKKKIAALEILKNSFNQPESASDALGAIESAVREFIENHSCSFEEVTQLFQATILPDELSKKEVVIRKELNKHYKNREDNKSKASAIYFAFKHAELMLLNPKEKWKTFTGLQRLQTNLKAEEYFEQLLGLMMSFQKSFKNHGVEEKLSKDIDRTFELWNSCNFTRKMYEQNCKSCENLISASDKHFMILGIIEYLDRRYKFNPKFRDEIIAWCEKDIEIYELFLVEFHEHKLFTRDELVKFHNDPVFKAKKIASTSIEKAKRLNNYLVPRLNSFDVSWSIYEHEKDSDHLARLEQIAKHIGYRNKDDNSDGTRPDESKELDLSTITSSIEVIKSGEKGKFGFINSSGDKCSTEDAYKDYMEQNGWNVMRAEVSFWQAMFCLCFWEEIFEGMSNPSEGNDIPHDLFRGADFYLNRKVAIDRKYEFISQQELRPYVNRQIKRYQEHWTRLIYNGDQNLVEYIEADIVQLFLDRIDINLFRNIIYRIAQNPNENRSGVSDFVVWNSEILKMVEVKKTREKVRESQMSWINWMVSENIPNEIVRVKGV
ncbi:MAG: hypothetical protein COB93_08100 [Sneathiella sp.]|nr:MAG: hypothetical protein COB93_08100 [Sneathiella sp.]